MAGASNARGSKCLALAYFAIAAINAVLAVSAGPPSAADLADCPQLCGDVTISFPYGIGSGCFRPGFEVFCNHSTQPPKLFLGNTTTTTQIIDTQLSGNVQASIVFNMVARRNGEPDGTTYNMSWEFPGRSLFILPDPVNHMVIVGCGIEVCMFDATDSGNMNGCCASMCDDITALEKGAEGRACSGLGCCYLEFQRSVRAFRLSIIQKEEALPDMFGNTTVKAFFEYSSDIDNRYRFNMLDLMSDKVNASTIGAVSANLSPVITDQPNCETAQLHGRYACDGTNCQDYGGNEEYNTFTLGINEGYRCACSNRINYGNPYLAGGCTQEYNPNQEKLNCSRWCGNTSIPFPFGLESGCSANKKFQLNCTSNQPLIGQSPAQYQVLNISVEEGLLYVHKPSDDLQDAEPAMTAIDVFSDGVFEQYLGDLVGFDFYEQSGIWKWVISNTTCDAAKNQTRYACISANSECISVTKGHAYVGYLCKCSPGYEGNPYVRNGCNDTNECLIPYFCNGTCHNWEGGYDCSPCRHGTSFHPVQRQCIATKSRSLIFVVAIGLGSAFGVLALTVCTTILIQQWKRHIHKKTRRAYFRRNKGLLLEQLISSEESATRTTKIFSLEELERATNNFDLARIVGCGGHGTVYKGILSDQRVVAIKKPKIIKQSEIDQFINEVAILSQIIHRNVVKLFGCCLESEVPLLVYEFIPNGTLYDLLHGDLSSKCLLTWHDRIRIALEAANALSYLHSAASIPIFHRDVKSANILLNDSFTTKVSDFGASRSISIDETHVVTIVQGTFGYLDPEYYHTGQLNEKSDVYSFGVILVELLTRSKPIFLNSFGEKQNLSHCFLQRLQDRTIEEMLDAQVIVEANQREIDEMALLAEICLRLRGQERPTMREVELRLQLLNDKITKKEEEYLQVDNEIDPLLLFRSNTNSLTQHIELGAVSNCTIHEATRCYTMEKELISWSDLPR